jgi:hypothetical protein
MYMDGILDQSGNTGTTPVQGIQMGSRSGTGGLRDFFIGEYFYLAMYEGVLTPTQHDEIGTELASIYGLTWPTAPPAAQDWYVSPTGSAGAAGTLASPWDLDSVLADTQPVSPGDTVYLLEGTYTGGNTNVQLSGTMVDPVVIKPYNDGKVLFDTNNAGAGEFYYVFGDYTHWYDIEVFCSKLTSRVTTIPGNNAPDADPVLERGSFYDYGNHNKFINMVFHDLDDGLGMWAQFPDTTPTAGGEMYGCIAYNNGWYEDGVTGRSHNVYSQNLAGDTKLFKDNILFHPFDHGLHCFSGTAGYVQDYSAIGNILFNAGAAVGGTFPHSRDTLIGGSDNSDNILYEENYTYHSGGTGETIVRLGNGTNCTLLDFNNNYLVGNLEFPSNWATLNSTGNTLVGTLEDTAVPLNNPTGITIDGSPTGQLYFVRPNTYAPKRAHIAVYNWADSVSISVDLDTVLTTGDRFDIFHVCDLDTPVLSGTYTTGVNVVIPLSDTTAPAPIGSAVATTLAAPVVVPREFGAFVLKPAAANEWYVSPTGSAGNDGTELSPWSLSYAFSHPPEVLPGDTIYLAGGTYSPAIDFRSEITGTASNPISVRPAPGENVVIDFVNATNSGKWFNIGFRDSSAGIGGYCHYYNLELTNSDPTSRQGSGGNQVDTNPRGGLVIAAPHVKIINCVIHDLSHQAWWAGPINDPPTIPSDFEANQGGEWYGNICYNVGFRSIPNGEGYYCYWQNRGDTKTHRDNLVGLGFRYGIHCYATEGVLEDFDCIGNTFWDQGCGQGSGYDPGGEVTFGGIQPSGMLRLNFSDNCAYREQAEAGQGLLVMARSGGGSKVGLTFENNYTGRCDLRWQTTWTGTVVSTNNIINIGVENDPTGVAAGGNPPATGITEVPSPTGTEIFIRPNVYEANRGHVTIFNWDDSASVNVDLSTVLADGVDYEIYHVYDLTTPRHTGTFDIGSPDIAITMQDTVAPSLIGGMAGAPVQPYVPSTMAREFGVFLVKEA